MGGEDVTREGSQIHRRRNYKHPPGRGGRPVHDSREGGPPGLRHDETSINNHSPFSVQAVTLIA